MVTSLNAVAKIVKEEHMLNQTIAILSTLIFPDINPPIIVATLNGDYDRIVQEISMGTPVDTRGHDGSTALIIAAANGSGDIVEFLVENGANLDLTNNCNISAIDKAILNNQEDIAEFLELSGAKKSHKTVENILAAERLANIKTAYDFIQLDLKTIETILSNPNFDINKLWPDYSYNSSNTTLLTQAIIDNKKEIVKLILKHPKLKINARDKEENTPLMTACFWSRRDIIKLLVEHPNISLNIKDSKGNPIYCTKKIKEILEQAAKNKKSKKAKKPIKKVKKSKAKKR